MNKKIWFIGILVVIGIFGFALIRKKEWTETKFMMDTVCEIKVVARLRPRKAIDDAFMVMHKIDSLASFEGSGDIARINRGENISVSPEVVELIKDGIKVGDLSQGAFDITVRPLMELWGDFKTQRVPDEKEINELLPLVDYKRVILNSEDKIEFGKRGMKLDLSGIAKGYAVDLAVEKLKSMEVSAGLVNAGGDMKVFGDRVWKIGIKNPRGSGIVKVLELKNQSVATSGDYEKYFILDGVRYHHILDPSTGLPASHCVSVTVISDSAWFADALATGIFVLGPGRGIQLLDSLCIPGLIITPDLQFHESKSMANF